LWLIPKLNPRILGTLTPRVLWNLGLREPGSKVPWCIGPRGEAWSGGYVLFASEDVGCLRAIQAIVPMEFIIVENPSS